MTDAPGSGTHPTIEEWEEWNGKIYLFTSGEIPMSDPGRVSPEDLEAMRNVAGCLRDTECTEYIVDNQIFPGGRAIVHATAAKWCSHCDDCRRLLYLAIARRVEDATYPQNLRAFAALVEEQTIQRCASDAMFRLSRPIHPLGAYAIAHAIGSLPRLYGSPSPKPEGET